MDYTKKTLEPVKTPAPPAATEPPATPKTDTGPKGTEMFPSTDEWKGKPVTGDYQTIPEDKEAIEENLKKAGEEVRNRFGLNEMGVPDADKAPTGK